MLVQPIILAAGKGSRMGNPDLPKVLTPLAGKPLLSYLLETFSHTAFLPAALVVGFQQEKVREAFAGRGYIFIEQALQQGTGSAVKVCEERLKGTADYYVVAYGDQPLWSKESIEQLVEVHASKGAVLSLATLMSDRSEFSNFGRIIRNSSGEVLAIREQRDCSPEELNISEYNPGLYCFSDEWLWKALTQITSHNAQGEYYLTDLLGLAVEQQEIVASLVITNYKEALGVNTPEQLQALSEAISR